MEKRYPVQNMYEKLGRFAGLIIGVLCAFGLVDAVYAESFDAPAYQAVAQAQVQQEAIRAAETPIAPIGLLSPTVAITTSTTVSVPAESTIGLPAELLPTPTPIKRTVAEPEADAAANEAISDEATPAESPANEAASSAATAGEPVADDVVLVNDEPLQGTMVANRSNYGARFFLEGRVYRIDPFGSANLDIARATSVMNLYTCDAETPETQTGCFWDPYVVESDGFYEIVDESTVIGLPELMLRNVNAPPDNQVWIHNRTGLTETIVFRDVVYDVAPGAVQEFVVDVGAPVIVYGRSCAQVDGEEVCEWAPESLDPGAYFGLVEVSTPGGVPGSSIITLDFRPVVGSSGAPAPAAPEMTCVLAVPALNIRSGPGLQYQIVGKIRSTETGPGSVVVVGRSADDMWYTVAENAISSGWVTSNPDFVTCDGTRNDLPIAEFHGVEIEPIVQPEPQVAVQPPVSAPAETDEQETVESAEAAVEEESTATEEPAPEQGPAIEDGQSLLVINNGFNEPIRFTIDQRYRPNDGPSEYDLEPSASVNIVTYPGNITFSVSTAWRNLSGNGDIEMMNQQATSLWLRFQPDPDGSDNWDLAWD